jgi:transposase
VTPPRRRYRTDLTNAQWQVLGSLVPQPKTGGRPAVHQRRELRNAMPYWLRAGCAWRLLPHDLPPWKTVYHSVRRWRLDGRWEQIVRVLRARERVRQGRRPIPSAAVLDSHSVKTTEGGAARPRRRQEGRAAASATCWSTPSGCCWPCTSAPPTSATATARPSCCAGSTGGTCRGCGMAGRTAATAARSWPGPWRGPRSPSRWWPVPMVDAGAVGCRPAWSRRWCHGSRSSRAGGGGADLRVAGPLPPPEQGLRVPHRDLRGGHPPSRDPAAGPPPGQQITFSDAL